VLSQCVLCVLSECVLCVLYTPVRESFKVNSATNTVCSDQC
jgi:hypothetical protein